MNILYFLIVGLSIVILIFSILNSKKAQFNIDNLNKLWSRYGDILNRVEELERKVNIDE